MGVAIVEGEEAVLRVNLGRPSVTNADSVVQLCESDELFPNDFGGGLVNSKKTINVHWTEISAIRFRLAM